MLLGPFLDGLHKVFILLCRQHHTQRDILVTSLALLVHGAFALQAQLRARVRALRYFHVGGAIKRWHFNAGPKSRGTKNIREPKSTGMHTDPGRVHKGWPMPGHMGAVLRKARNLDIVRVEEAENLIVVRGSVPGPNGGYVYIQASLTQPPEKGEKSEKK